MVDNDIAFHFNPRNNAVVYDSCRNGTWEKNIENPGGPFVKGGAFDVLYFINSTGYEVRYYGGKKKK